ncbi:MAG: hypothetical protein RLQ12_20630 [Cyclobacteriaceae bacterium]
MKRLLSTNRIFVKSNGRLTGRAYLFSMMIILLGCVPYQQQVYERQLAILHTSKPCKIVNNKTLYENQLKFEQFNMENGKGITLNRILPENDFHEKQTIILVDNNLIIPVSTYKEVHMQSEYLMVWDGEYFVDEPDNYHFNLIFIENRPEVIQWSTTREMKYPITMNYSFDISRFKYPDTDTLKVNVLGLDTPISYSYQ